jgi:hypothetical protein
MASSPSTLPSPSTDHISIINNAFGIPFNLGLSTPYGNQFVDLTGANPNGTGTGVLKQTIATKVGHKYTLAFALGINSVFGIGFNPPTTTVTAGGTTQDFTFSPTFTPGINETKWGGFTLDFVANGSTSDISFAVNNPLTDFVGLDNVSVTKVPEPSAVLGLGVLGLSAFSLRKRIKANPSNKKTD